MAQAEQVPCGLKRAARQGLIAGMVTCLVVSVAFIADKD